MPEATQLVGGRATVPGLLAPSATPSHLHHSCQSRGRAGRAPGCGGPADVGTWDRCAMMGAREAGGVVGEVVFGPLETVDPKGDVRQGEP